MAKKDLNNAVSTLLGGKQEQTTTEVKKKDARTRNRSKVAFDKDRTGYEIATILVHSQTYAKMKEIAYKENLTIKKVVEAAMKKAVEKYESTRGEIKISNPKFGNEEELFN